MALVMKGTSRQSLAMSRALMDSSLASMTGEQASTLAADLFLITRTLDSSKSLLRALTDPSREAQGKAGVAQALFGQHVGANAAKLLEELVKARWSRSSDLANATEQLAVEAESAAANADGTLDALEAELFQFGRVVAGNSDLRAALVARNLGTSEQKGELVRSLLAGKVAPATLRLIVQLVMHPRGRHIEGGLNDFAQAAADRRNRMIAHVKSAIELTPAQQERLSAALTAELGRPMRVNVEVDKSVVGGLSIRFADELIDGTTVSRLAEASRRLAG
ncbi:MAG: F0F1 ATP synthase subunit delta [Actinobacteria bacterium]|nr:F0F1 ATP synthase subunit delta [Actinomycetota bacterium]